MIKLSTFFVLQSLTHAKARPQVKNLGMKQHLRMLGLMPIFGLSCLFFLMFYHQSNQTIQQQTQQLNHAFLQQLMPLSRLVIQKNSARALHTLIETSEHNPHIKAFALYNQQGHLLTYQGTTHTLRHTSHLPPCFHSQTTQQTKLSSYTTELQAPILIPPERAHTRLHTTHLNATTSCLGWLVVDIDQHTLILQHEHRHQHVLFFLILGVLLCLILYYVISKRLYHPVQRLRRSMTHLLHNEFETPIVVSSEGEMGVIEQGCAHLQHHLILTQEEQSQQIEQATYDLQQSLASLEEKNIAMSLDKKKREETNRQKSAFIANMSHEIRTPMNGILGFTNMLIESNLDPLQLDYVKTIKSSAHDLLNIMNNILDYSKMEAGKLNLKELPLNIRTCIDEVLSMMLPSAHQKNLDLIPITDVNVPKIVCGDPWRIKQIMNNLLSNAIKFTPEGYVLIRTSLLSETETHYNLSLSITDTGIGISSTDQPALFHPFNQGETNVHLHAGGTGLGLAICKQLVEHMHGHIAINSELNKGTTLSVQLPLRKWASYEVEKQQTLRFSSLTALCFDENPLYLDSLCCGLMHFGIQCLRMDTWAQLKEMLNTHTQANIAFVNVHSGNEVNVSNLLHQSNIPCVFLLKNMLPELRTFGAQGFLLKPFNLQKLNEVIDAVLEKPFSKQTLTRTPAALAPSSHLDALRKKLRHANASILIAEDNVVNQRLLHSLLNEYTTLDIVADGEQAMAICNQQRYAMLLLDLHMPNMNGLDAARHIRHNSLLNKHTPIILISANARDIDQQDLQKNDIALFLQKPIDEVSLFENLIQLIDANQSSPINWPLCIQKMSGNESMATEFLGHFITELRLNREEFLQIWNKRDLGLLERSAHKLHGACCFCGVPDLQRNVANIEMLAKHTSSIDDIQAEFTQLIESIDEVINAYPAHLEHQHTLKEI